MRPKDTGLRFVVSLRPDNFIHSPLRDDEMAEEDALQRGGGQALNKWNELFAASFAMPSNQCFFVFFSILSSSNFSRPFFPFFWAKF